LLADIYYAKSDVSTSQSNYPDAAKELNKALTFRTEHVYQDKLSYVYASLALTEASVASPEALNDLFQKSISLNRDSLTASPMNISYWKTRAKDYYYFYQLNQDEELFNTATQSLKIAREISPTDPKIPQTEALFYSLRIENEKDQVKKDSMIKEALRLLDISIKLKPNYVEAIQLEKLLRQ
jgi:tetratricopeptide (TPR) repeat protein